ncbi:MAG: CheR family methyltransferase [Spirochaetota bacterium]
MAIAHLSEREFRRLAEFIEGNLGIRMPPTKKVMLESRLHKRLRILDYDSYTDYLDHVFAEGTASDELVHMIDAVTTNKTDFFREPDHFRYLQEKILPRHVEHDGWGYDEPLHTWSAAASSGEEPYTLAMVLQEFARQNSGFQYDVLGTDISTRVLERARQAVYPVDRLAPVSADLKKRYFLKSKDATKSLARVKPELRRAVRYQRLNLMDDDFGLRQTFHVIFCRNVIIYFDRPRQLKLVEHLYRYLRPSGYLILGHSETLAGADLPYRTVAPTIYQRID